MLLQSIVNHGYKQASTDTKDVLKKTQKGAKNKLNSPRKKPKKKYTHSGSPRRNNQRKTKSPETNSRSQKKGKTDKEGAPTSRKHHKLRLRKNKFTPSAPNERELYKSDNNEIDPTRDENIYKTILHPTGQERVITNPIINRMQSYERTNNDYQEFISGTRNNFHRSPPRLASITP